MRFLTFLMFACSFALSGFWWHQHLEANATVSTLLPSVTIEHFSMPTTSTEPVTQTPMDADESWKEKGQGMSEESPRQESELAQAFDAPVTPDGLNTPIAQDLPQCLVLGPIKEELLPKFRAKMETLDIFDKAYVEKVMTDEQFWVYIGPYDTEAKAKEVEQKALQSFADIKVGRLEMGGWAVFLRTFKDEFEARSWLQQASVILGGPRLSIYRPKMVDHHLVNLVFNQVHHKDVKRIRALGEAMNEKVFKCSLM